MKKTLFFIFAAIAMLSSCSKEKTVKVVNLELQGDLKGCYTILDSVCTATKNDGKYSITVNLQRTEESVPYTDKTIGVFSKAEEKDLVLGGIGYETYNPSNDLIESIDAPESKIDAAEQLNVLKLAPGEKAAVTITFDKEVPDGIILTSELKFISTGEITLNGAIGKYGIKNFSIDFNFETKKIIGQYQYLTSPAGAFLYLLGNVVNTEYKAGDFSSNILIAEDNGHGELSGKFKGQLKLVRDSKTSPYYYVVVGTFRNYRYQDFRYELKSAPITEIEYGNVLKNGYASTMNPAFVNEDFSQFGFRSFSEEANYGGDVAGDVSVGEFLRQYRRFFKHYLIVLKKYKAGDPTVLLEYAELANKYASLQEQAEKIKGQMSPSQLNELQQITEELTKAISAL